MKKKLVTATAALLVTLGLAGATDASAKTVQRGETLWGIAQTNGTSVGAIQRANGISGHLIYPGQNLVIPNGGHVAQAQPKQYSQPTYKRQVAKTNTASNNTAGRKLTVSATAYTANCHGCSGITATGIDVRNSTPPIIAVDPNVIPLGSKVYVPGFGVMTAGDTGGAIKGNKIDILVSSNSQALQWGRRNITITVLD